MTDAAHPHPRRPATSSMADEYFRTRRRRSPGGTPRGPRIQTRGVRRYDRYHRTPQPARTDSATPPQSATGTVHTGDASPGASLPPDADATAGVASQRRPVRPRRIPLRRRKWFWAATGIPAVMLIAVAIILTPVIYESINAYREVKVDSVDHQDSAFVPALNDAGTPELVAAPTEMAIPEWTGTDRVTILLLGVDKAANGASRTDTIILVNIDPVEKSAAILSIPRDLKVVIPGYGIDKINAAFALGEFNQVQGGGAGLTIRTIEANLGIPIAHFATIDFTGFVKMIDTAGGITIDVPYPIKDDVYPADNFQYQRIYFPAGWQHLDGEAALQYARTRSQDGDQRRSERQQQVLLALREQAINRDLISSIPQLIAQFGDSVRTDIPVNSAIALAQLGAEIPRDEIVQYSLMPALYDEEIPGEPYYLVADWDATGDILSEFVGAPVNPPGAALANPEFDLPVLILNGTDNEGLAGRIGDTLEWNGFTDVSVGLAEDGDDVEASTITDNGGYLGTSALITNLIGVGADQITVNDQAPLATEDNPFFDPTPTSIVPSLTGGSNGSGGTPGEVEDYDVNDYAIVIVLGEDAPDPADDALQLEEYQDQVESEGIDEPFDPVNGEPVDPDTGEPSTRHDPPAAPLAYRRDQVA